jgi:hypothetical protein
MTRVPSSLFPALALLALLAPLPSPADTLPAATCTADGAGGRACALFALPGGLTLPGLATPVTIWGYAETAAGPATSPGPALVVNQGETVTISLTNALPVATSLRISGQPLVADLNGVAPGGTGTYTFVAGAPGTYLYEAGVLPGTQYQVAMGLYGPLVVRPSGFDPLTPQAFADAASAYDDEALVLLGELDPALNGSANPAAYDLRGLAPRYWLINGHPYPDTTPIPTGPGRRVLLRYANAGVEAHAMGLLGLRQALLAVDGGRTPRPMQLVSQTVAAGQTADAIATVPAAALPGARFPLYEGRLALHNAGQPGFGGMLTFLQVTGTGTPGGVGPVTSAVAVAPSPTTGTAGVTVTALVTSVGSTVAAAELFVDQPGAAGTGVAMAASDSAFGGTSEAVTGAIAPATLAALATGSHAIYVRGQDGAGTWGPVSSASLLLDAAGPAISTLTATPNPTTGSTDLIVAATGDDRATGGASVVAAELFLDPAGTPAPGSGSPLLAGTISDVTPFTGSVPAAQLAALAEGDHTIAVRAQDSLGTWGALRSLPIRIDRTGPVASAAAAVPAATNGVQGVSSGNASLRLTATLTDTASRVAAGEAFIDAAGAIGSGFPVIPVDGLMNTLSEQVFADIPLATIAQLTQGTHALLVRGRDAAGNWGATTSASFQFETGRPVVSGAAVTPNPTAGAPLVTLTASAADPAPSSGVSAAEWFDGADPGVGRGTPMQAADGAYGGATEALTATIDVVARGWLAGARTLSIRARDAAGTWSAVATVAVTVQLPDAVFADGFEAGNTAAWNGGAVGAGLAVTTAARLTATGTYGLAVTAGAAARYVQDDTPASETTYHARFWFNPNGTGTGNNIWDILQGVSGAQVPFRVQYQRLGGAGGTYRIRAQLLTTGGNVNTPYVNISSAAHAVEIAWSAGSGAGVRLQLYVDGVLRQSLSGQNTSPYRIDSVRLGRPAGANGGSTGTLYLDQFVSRRYTVIGP